MRVASSALVRRLVPKRSAGPGASAIPGVLSRICTHGSGPPARAQPTVSIMAVRAWLSARAVMSSGAKAQIFWANRVASGASVAPLPGCREDPDLLGLPSAVMGLLQLELGSHLKAGCRPKASSARALAFWAQSHLLRAQLGQSCLRVPHSGKRAGIE